jgi:hypothetical protein
MEIQPNHENYKVLNEAISDLMELLKVVSDDFKDIEIKEKYRLSLFDISLRIFPNIKAIDSLLQEYFHRDFTGINLSIGLIMRCCLEDMLFGHYILTFREYPEMMDMEIDVKSLQLFKNFIHFIKEYEPEYFLCEEEKIEEIKKANDKTIESLKLKYPVFYEDGQLAKVKTIRRRCDEQNLFFNRDTRNRASISDMYKRLKEFDFNFSYIYFVYKYYCLYEHYNYHSRFVIEMNPYSFGQLSLGFEFICRGLQKIVPFITESDKYDKSLIDIKNKLGKLIKK